VNPDEGIKVKSVFQYRNVYLAALPGVLMGGLTLLVDKFASISADPLIGVIQKTVMILVIPGLIGSTIISNNVHEFSLVLAAIINTIAYFALGLLHFGSWQRLSD
jgi:hypothetical protein